MDSYINNCMGLVRVAEVIKEITLNFIYYV